MTEAERVEIAELEQVMLNYLKNLTAKIHF